MRKLAHLGSVISHGGVDGWVIESTQTFTGAAQASAPRTYR
jgi:hypothetical protein